jgi:carbon monoxide dehydrogenase subunit G
MKLEGDYLFDASVPEVWSALFDPVILAAVMPGCEKLDLVDGAYVGEIKVKVGPIQGKFTGKVDLKDKDEPRSYTMVVDGRGAPGFVKATAGVKLAAEGTGTRVFYDTDAQVGGKIASVGQRLLEASARAIVAQSLEGLSTNIKLRAAAYREAAGKDAAAPAAPVPVTEPPEAVAAAEPADAAAPTVPAAAAETAVATASSILAAAEASPAAAAAAGAELAAAETAAAKAASLTPAATESVAAKADAGTTKPLVAGTPAAPAVAFTPVKVKQSDLANAVAKEVASSLFPRSVLVAIIVVEALIIVWLLVSR